MPIGYSAMFPTIQEVNPTVDLFFCPYRAGFTRILSRMAMRIKTMPRME